MWLESSDGKLLGRVIEDFANSPDSDITIEARVPEDARPTEPYFTRPTPEQLQADISHQEWRGRSFAPYPLSGWAEFRYEGVPILLGETVQTMQRVVGIGGVLASHCS